MDDVLQQSVIKNRISARSPGKNQSRPKRLGSSTATRTSPPCTRRKINKPSTAHCRKVNLLGAKLTQKQVAALKSCSANPPTSPGSQGTTSTVPLDRPYVLPPSARHLAFTLDCESRRRSLPQRHALCFRSIHGFIQKPRSPFRLIDPNFDQTSRSHVSMLIANFMRRAK